MDKMREEFEEWANVNGLRLERQKSMCGGDMGRYDFGPTQAAMEVWCDAWQAANKSAVPDGYCVVPVEPTDEMMEAADDWSIGSDGVTIGWFTSSEIYKEMIKKAPKP